MTPLDPSIPSQLRTIEAIQSRRRAGESLKSLAYDYSFTIEEIKLILKMNIET